MFLYKKKNQSGYTLIELSIGVTVVALVIAGVLSGAKQVMESYRFNRTITQLSGAIEYINKIMKRETNTSFVTDFNLTRPNYNVFKDFQLEGGSPTVAPTIRTASGVQVFTGNSDGPSWSVSAGQKYYSFFLAGVSVGQCGDLAAMMEGYADIIVVRYNGGSETTVKSSTIPFDSTTVRNACATGSVYALKLQMNTY